MLKRIFIYIIKSISKPDNLIKLAKASCCLFLLFTICLGLRISTIKEKNVIQAEAGALQTGLNNLDSNINSLESKIDELQKSDQNQQNTISSDTNELENSDNKEMDANVTEAPDPTDKLVAITFDDGPGKYTDGILDELANRNMKATFFVLGSRAEQYPDIIKRIADEGHEIGNHTYSHTVLEGKSKDEIIQELTRTDDIVKSITGDYQIKLFRPPEGRYDDTVLSIAKENDLSLVLWSVDSQDWLSKNKKSIMEKIFSEEPYNIKDGSIILLHDIQESTRESCADILDRIIKEGYTPVTVSELLTLRGQSPTPGEVYKKAPQATE